MKCPTCGHESEFIALQRHHKYSQTSTNRKYYGDLLDDPRNIQIACCDCHPSHRSEKLIHWTEQEFCDALNISPRSKLGKGIRQQFKTPSLRAALDLSNESLGLFDQSIGSDERNDL